MQIGLQKNIESLLSDTDFEQTVQKNRNADSIKLFSIYNLKRLKVQKTDKKRRTLRSQIGLSNFEGKCYF